MSAAETITVPGMQQPAAASHFWAGNGFSFHDLLDAINPLQHIPVIGTLYRHWTGDKIGNVAEIVGDGLYGGLIGLASGVVNVAIKEATGKDLGETVLAMVDGVVDGDDRTGAMPAAGSAAPQSRPTDRTDPDTVGAQLTAAAPPPSTAAGQTEAAEQHGSRPPQTSRGFMPIDTSDRGILNLRALAATHNPQPVALSLPPGTKLATPAAPVDFVAKMREGLDKYQALMSARPSGPNDAVALDQSH